MALNTIKYLVEILAILPDAVFRLYFKSGTIILSETRYLTISDSIVLLHPAEIFHFVRGS